MNNSGRSDVSMIMHEQLDDLALNASVVTASIKDLDTNISVVSHNIKTIQQGQLCK